MEKNKWLLAILTGVIGTISNQYAVILIFVIAAVVLDVITGLVKAMATGEGLSSEKGHKGFWKKISFFVALVFGCYLDYFIPFMLSNIGVNLPLKGLFSVIFACYICLNEAVSICENLYLINSDILPKWVVRILKNAKNQINTIDKKDGE